MTTRTDTIKGDVLVRVFGDKNLDRTLNKLASQFPADASRALNRTADQARTGVRRRLAKKIGIAQKLIKGRVRAYKSTPKSLVATVWIGTKYAINVIGAGGKVKASGALALGKYKLSGVFLATMPSGHRAYFVRKPGSKHKPRNRGPSTELPIEEPKIRLAEPGRPIIEEETRKQMREFYPKELRRLVAVTVARNARRRK